MKWLKQILTSLLDDWFVPLEDYELVQRLRWSADEHVRRQQGEILRLYDEIYSRYKTLEQYGESAELTYTEHERFDLDELECDVRMRISRWQMVSFKDINQFSENIKWHFCTQLCNAFRAHIYKAFNMKIGEQKHASGK